MFLEEAVRTRITKEATDDLTGFIAHSAVSEELAEWEKAQAEMISVNSHFVRSSSLEHFIHYLFQYLDSNPIYATSQATNTVELRGFLRNFHKWLECFASADENLPEFYGISHIMDFGHFLANVVLKRTLHWTNASRPSAMKKAALPGYPKDDFVSWMIVMDKNKIHIIYDEVKMRGQKRPIFFIQQIFERVLLHELGHARQHLTYFESAIPGMSSMPRHETEAWFYALMIRSIVVGTRARIDRYLGLPDSAYPL